MKKKIIAALLLLILGTILGTKIYSAKESIENVFASGQIYYFLQEGVYTSKEIMEENTKNITSKIINKENNKYYVYLGITKDETNIFENNRDRITKMERYGSAIKACRIAQGLAEVSFRLGNGTKEWDTAASQIVVLEAGGIFAKPDLSEIKYNRVDVYNREGFVILNRKENLLK